MSRNIAAGMVLLLAGPVLRGQVMPADSLWEMDMPDVVVTATRSERLLQQATVPALLIPARTIRMSGGLRLHEILQEQTGLFLTSGSGSSAVGGGVFGNGIQIQGFAPDYTLILLDGEPLTGRQGGVLDLSRLTVGNIRKIEVIKGPSSALYGSEAMGGVVNILTEQRRGTHASGGVRYGSFRTADTYGSVNVDRGKSTLYLFGNYLRSDGYDLAPDTPERTIDPHRNGTAQVKWTWRFSDRTRLVWNNRLYRGRQEAAFVLGTDETRVEGQSVTSDYNIHPVLTHRINDRLKTSLRTYGSYYRYEQDLHRTDSGSTYYRDDFQHLFTRMENQTDWDWNEKHQLVAGGGYNGHTVETSRYRTRKNQHLGYVFVQNEWRPTARWIVIPGLRYDLHTDFANRLSPKLSMQYRPNPQWHYRFSYGSGFKAPDFRQLYLHYANPAAQGYRIYGAAEFSIRELEEMEASGEVARILPEAWQIGQLRPEVSHGFNAGVGFAHSATGITADLNLFWNEVTDMIQYLPVAILANNALVFSYRNVASAWTGGAEVNVRGTAGRLVEWAAGYQYLMTGDRDVVAAIREGNVYGRSRPGGPARRMTMSDYTGLMGRSPHMAQARVQVLDESSGWGGSVRALYRSRWGVVDLDGNGFANMEEEYARGFVLLNLSVMKTFARTVTAQVSVNNLTDHRDAVNVPHMPGRHVMLGFHWNFLH